jgi:PHP family Zn ribbon phosphoesterase
MAPDPDPVLSAAHVATLTWDHVADCELLRRSHEALREQVRVLTEMHRQAISDADELRARARERMRDLENDARARFAIERAKLERRVRELETAISKVLAWSEFAFPQGEPAAIRDSRATVAP